MVMAPWRSVCSVACAECTSFAKFLIKTGEFADFATIYLIYIYIFVNFRTGTNYQYTQLKNITMYHHAPVASGSITYRGRFVETPCCSMERAAGRPLFRGPE